MSAEKEETAGTTSSGRHRGSRGGRGRTKRAAEESNDQSLSDPRIAGRRPSQAAQPAEQAEEKAEPAKARAPRRRRPPAAKAEVEVAEQAAANAPAPAEKTPTRQRTPRAAKAAEPAEAPALVDEVRALRTAIEAQAEAIATLGETHERTSRRLRLGIFVDVPNLIYGAERGEGVDEGSTVHMGKLLGYLSDGRELIRATAYSPVSDDPAEPVERQRFVAPFVPHDYRIVTKPMKRFADGSVKGNFDVEMALDMVTMADRLDIVVVVSGDADFARAVELLQGKGVRVEVVAFSGSTSIEMRALADRYIDVGQIMDRVGA